MAGRSGRAVRRGPDQARSGRPGQDVLAAGSVFVGATRYRGPLAWLRLNQRWNAMVRQMQRMPGYLHHQVYYEPPFTLGTVGYFRSREDMLRFARTGGHRELMLWVVDGAGPTGLEGQGRNASGGYIRLYEPDEETAPGGPAAGDQVVVELGAPDADD